MRTFNDLMKRLIITVILLVGCVSSADAQDDTTEIIIDGTIHYGNELYSLVERSNITYLWDITDSIDSILGKLERPVLPPALGTFETERGRVLDLYPFPDTVVFLMDVARFAFKRNEYLGAIHFYRKAAELAPDMSTPLAQLGNCYYTIQEFDSARAVLLRAIDINPHDFTAYWVLADTYHRMDSLDRAWDHLLMTHLLNRNEEDIRKALFRYRADMGMNWDNWEFIPRYHAYRDSADSMLVHVTSHPVCAGYALAKAFWEFEPGYRENMAPGADVIAGVNMTEEVEAFHMAYPLLRDSLPIDDILFAGYLHEFIVYEMIAPKHPVILLTIDPASRQRVAEYVNRFH
ncbi:MAG: tetratricopeptide repeat protein [candidate division Zixibacteria bacterium]|nr:tetratricopeptide repeat protein [candidate division Zixibacteria bacterium]